MIIDGKLIVSKKKKAVLVAELRKLNFTPFPKVADAKNAGEDEDAQEDEESEEAEVNASDYDYLLGVSGTLTTSVSYTDFRRWLSGR
jgi:DNA topoisomerase-2